MLVAAFQASATLCLTVLCIGCGWQAARGLWHDPHTLWQVAQLQQLMQTAQSQALSTTGR